MITGIESAKLKLLRAAEHIEAVTNAVWNYTADEPSTVVRQSDGSAKLKFQIAPPSAISILCGETIYQIRSAIDHLAFELVQVNPAGITLPADWEEKCVFPLWLKTPKKKPIFNCFEHLLPGISIGAFTFIEAAQPYNGGDLGNVLRLLAVLSNIDKHRYLNITKPQAYQRDSVVVRHHGRIMLSDSVMRVEDGTKIESPYAGMDVQEVKMQGAFTPYVSFHESALGTDAATLPVQNVLEACLNTVNGLMVPAFEKFIEKP